MNIIKEKFIYYSKKVWNFLWKDDSIWSWLANIVVAFLVIRFIFYPVLGIILGTGYPIVAVVSESMEHSPNEEMICGQKIEDYKDSFDNYWEICGKWYENNDITKEDFRKFPLKDGFYKGDVIILWRPSSLDIGDVLVFQGDKPQPIIHRVVDKWEENGNYFYQTKGDHNRESFSQIKETKIEKERIYGKGILRVPYLGWVKILAVDAVKPLGITIER